MELYVFDNEPGIFYYGDPLDEETLYSLDGDRVETEELIDIARKIGISGFFSMPANGVGSENSIMDTVMAIAYSVGITDPEVVEYHDYLATKMSLDEQLSLEDEENYYVSIEKLENYLLGYSRKR